MLKPLETQLNRKVLFMKKYIFLSLLAIISIMFSGCAVVKTGKNYNKQEIALNNPTPIATIYGNNYGYYLFSFFPIVTGNPKNSNEWIWFSDKANVGTVTDMVTKKASELGATKTINMESRVDFTGRMFLWIIYYKNVQVSASAVK